MILNRIFKLLFQAGGEIVMIALFFLPFIPVILFVENQALKNFLYTVMVPLNLIMLAVVWKRMKIKAFNDAAESEQPVLGTLSPHLKNEIILDKDKLDN